MIRRFVRFLTTAGPTVRCIANATRGERSGSGRNSSRSGPRPARRPSALRRSKAARPESPTITPPTGPDPSGDATGSPLGHHACSCGPGIRACGAACARSADMDASSFLPRGHHDAVRAGGRAVVASKAVDQRRPRRPTLGSPIPRGNQNDQHGWRRKRQFTIDRQSTRTNHTCVTDLPSVSLPSGPIGLSRLFGACSSPSLRPGGALLRSPTHRRSSMVGTTSGWVVVGGAPGRT